MRVVNVIETSDYTILGVESFPIFEEQLSQDVIEEAKENFRKKVLENGGPMDDEQMEEYVEDKYFRQGDFGDIYTVSIVFSEI